MTEKKKIQLPMIVANDCANGQETPLTKQEQDNIAFKTLDRCIKQLAPFLSEQERRVHRQSWGQE